MAKTPLDTKQRIESLLKLASKSNPELLIHVYELQDKFEQMQEDLTEKMNEVINSTPVKGKDYLTENDIAEMEDNIFGKMPKVENLDKEELVKEISDSVIKNLPKVPKEDKKTIDIKGIAEKVAEIIGSQEENEPIDHTLIAQEVSKLIVIPTPETGETLRDKLETLEEEDKLPQEAIKDLSKTLKSILRRFSDQSWINKTRGVYNGLRAYLNGVETSDTPISNIYFVGGTVNNDGQGNLTVNLSGSGGALTPEIPTGTIDGTNNIFHVNHPPVQYFWNGQYQNPNASDYTYDSGTGDITMATPPFTGDNLISFY